MPPSRFGMATFFFHAGNDVCEMFFSLDPWTCGPLDPWVDCLAHLLNIATIYNVTDLVLYIVRQLLNSDLLDKNNIVAVARAIRDAVLEEAEVARWLSQLQLKAMVIGTWLRRVIDRDWHLAEAGDWHLAQAGDWNLAEAGDWHLAEGGACLRR